MAQFEGLATGVHLQVPSMHVSGEAQPPHESVPPQPSSKDPHVTPAASHVVCTILVTAPCNMAPKKWRQTR